MNKNLAGKRVFIRNVDKTDDIQSIRFLLDGTIGITFKGLGIEYKYSPNNIKIIEEESIPAVDEYEQAYQNLIDREQKTLNTIIECINETMRNRVYDHIPYLSPYYRRNKKHSAKPYENLKMNPYFAKMKFLNDDTSYYISEHNVNKLSSELDLPKGVKIISVYSDLGKHIYDRNPTFYAKKPLGKLIPFEGKTKRYNIDAKLNSDIINKYIIVEKLRFNIRNGKIKELKDDTPR